MSWLCCLLRGHWNGRMFGQKIGAAWSRRIPIVALLLGLSPIELQTRPGVPILLKKRDLLQLNEVDVYLDQLAARMREQQG
jgi:hypothetical protein